MGRQLNKKVLVLFAFALTFSANVLAVSHEKTNIYRTKAGCMSCHQGLQHSDTMHDDDEVENQS